MLSTDRHPLNSFQPTSQAQGIFSPLLDFFQHFGFNCALFNSKKHWLINNSNVSRSVSSGKVEPLASPCKLGRAGNTMELSSHHSQRALGDKQTLSLSGILITTTRGREKGCARRENTFICFLHAETRGNMWRMMVEGIRAQLTSRGTETTSERTVQKSLHFLAMARATRREKTNASLLCPWLVSGTQQGPGSLCTEQVQHWPGGHQQAQVCKLLCSSHWAKQD